MLKYDIGDDIIISRPFVHVLSTSKRGILCDECFERQDKFLRCSACKISRYCSATCQKPAWRLHKWECEALQRVAPRVPTDSVRLLYRLMIKIQKCSGTAAHEDVLGRRRTFDSLMSHTADIRSDPQRAQEFLQLVHTLNEFAGDSLQMPSPDHLLDIFGKMVINSFSICDDEMQPVGVGLYLGASVLDHSCDPNAVVVFRGTDARVRCLRRTVVEQPITAQISPVTISYIDQLSSRESRQVELLSQYYFNCQCAACVNTDLDSSLAGKCPRDGCHGVVLESDLLKCLECGMVDFSTTYREKRIHFLTQMKDAISSLKQMQKQQDYKRLLACCECHISDFSDIFHPSCVFMVQLYDLAMESCVQLELWSKAALFAKDVTKGFRLYYRGQHPSLGLHLMKLGKILLYLRELDESLPYLQQAEDILSVTHGKDHRLCQELRDLISQCSEELRGHLS